VSSRVSAKIDAILAGSAPREATEPTAEAAPPPEAPLPRAATTKPPSSPGLRPPPRTVSTPPLSSPGVSLPRTTTSNAATSATGVRLPPRTASTSTSTPPSSPGVSLPPRTASTSIPPARDVTAARITPGSSAGTRLPPRSEPPTSPPTAAPASSGQVTGGTTNAPPATTPPPSSSPSLRAPRPESSTSPPSSTGETGRIAKALDSLPTLPIVALRIGEVVHSKNASVQQVAEVMRSDPSMSAKLLRLVNSAYFGIPGGVADIERAIPFVGFNTLYQLVLSISVLDALAVKSSKFDPRALWVHSLTVGTAARLLADELKSPDAGACFTAGLLHDIGKIALAKVDPENLAAAYDSMKRDGITLAEAEKLHGLAPHDRVGARLARQWRFPAKLQVPIEHHHNIHKPEIRDRLAPNLRQITEIVTASDFISEQCAKTVGAEVCGEDGDGESAAMFERNGFSELQLNALYDKTMKELEKSKIFLSLLPGG
jgi:putative nucleotidyltransferase with HDIG domain